jgi:hypothetical protein
MTVVAAGTFENAAEKNYPELVANLTYGSAWMDLILDTDDPARSNSPYYGPSAQFLVDCYFDVVAATPELLEAASTPQERSRTAEYIITRNIGKLAAGPRGLIAKAYKSSDVAETAVHSRRRQYLMRNRRHILEGAIVPFYDVARVSGGAALMLEEGGLDEAEITDTISGSKGLHIVARVHGTETPLIMEGLGLDYFEPEYFLKDDEGLVGFSQAALDIIELILSPHGCPTAKIEDGPDSLFVNYWKKITSYLLTGVNYEDMHLELESQRREKYHAIKETPLKPNKRYTPSKRKI